LGSAEALAALHSQDGHLLHMPSHIFVRVGQYKRAVVANKAAYDHDLARGSQCIVPYLPEHNVNLLVYAARCGWLRTSRAPTSSAWCAKSCGLVGLGQGKRGMLVFHVCLCCV
jgi:hypothetical protein